MRAPKRIAAGLASVVLVIGAGAGIAQAKAGGGGGGGGHGMPAAAAIATYLGVTQAELRTQLEAGKSFADVAKAQGKTVAGLEDAIYSDASTHLDQAVTDRKLTAGQETTMLADLESHLDDIVNGTGVRDGGPGRGHGHGGPFDPAAIATYLGLTQAQLRTQFEAGKSLADVVKAQGKTVAGLEDAIVAAAKSTLDQAVADGKLSAAQEAAMLADLKSHVDDMVNRTGPPSRDPHGAPPGAPATTATTRTSATRFARA